MTAPGWYPDPVGDYEVRWWDGHAWSASVGNGGAVFEDPPSEPTLPPQETVMWEADGRRLTTHRLWINDPLNHKRVVELYLWGVAGVEVTRNAGQHQRGTGRIAVEVAYPGYGGPRHYVMKDVYDADLVAAMIGKWANRNRRAHRGY